ncbi:hypothetical protein E1B28_003799 [Marasmius oreades]|uniref:Mid2 domain-containing protein n=1 Tax=Marasmius oreades TaxID=181124 RepID=A0A9P7UXA4_9AGAR|nr:uncharacterized protein E1B28_003799 [Marasmius oreades]KAG7096355.1 hypothetical protein E1B28_003799 [Marasmius oreades]
MTERFIRRCSSATSCFLTLLVLCGIFSSGSVKAKQIQEDYLRNVSIANTSPEITYTPFFCNSSTSEVDCKGGWRALDVDGLTVVSTDGPSEGGVNIVPQMFFSFRASNLFMTTSPLSNVSINVTVLTGNVTVNAMANSSLGSLAVVNLQETDTTTISITYVPDLQMPARLDIGNITIMVKNDSVSSSFLPTQTLPPSISLPTVIPTSSSSNSATPTTTSDNTKKKLVAHAVGLTIGLGLGLTAVACVIYMLWRRRRRKQREDSMVAGGTIDHASASRWNRELPSLAEPGRQSMSSYLSRRATKDHKDTRWFR